MWGDRDGHPRFIPNAVRDHIIGANGEAALPVGLHITVEEPAAGLPPLPAAVEVAAYRIALEALTNVARHAHAQNCVVRVALDPPHLRGRLEGARGVLFEAVHSLRASASPA